MKDPATADREFRSRRFLVLASIVQLAKRIGLSKQVVRLAFRRLFSEKAKARSFTGYEPDEHDVFVTTFAKSGTNWMMQIAQQIAHRGAAEFEHIHQLVPWPDSPGPGPVALDDPAPRDASPTGLRVIKTHLEPEFVPYAEGARYLTMIRDPKEVLVSSYYFLGGILDILDRVTIHDWFDLFMAPDALATQWARHSAGYWSWRDRTNVVVITYPEAVAEPRVAVERVARVMGVDLNEAELAAVLERSSFAYMKAHESQFAPPRPVFGGDRPLMVRRGEPGGSAELLDATQQVEIDRRCRAELARLGSDFPYAEAFDLAEDAAA